MVREMKSVVKRANAPVLHSVCMCLKGQHYNLMELPRDGFPTLLSKTHVASRWLACVA
jgi:hypothetical protein